MEFDLIVKFFSSLSPIKRKYPMVLSYQKYLSKLTESNKKMEIDCFKNFLISNPSIGKKEFNKPYYEGSKRSSPFFMENVIQLGNPELQTTFWEQINNMESIFFPEGKPEGATGVDNAFAELENNPVFADVIDQVRTSVANMDDVNIGNILESPDFCKMVGNIKNGLETKKYKLSDLTSIIGSLKDELDPNTQKTLNMVTTTLEAVNRGETPDMGKVMEAIQSLKLN